MESLARISFVVLLAAHVGESFIYVNRGNSSGIVRYDDLPAHFGPPVPTQGFTGYVLFLRSVNNSCEEYYPPAPEPSRYRYPWIALMLREGCKFDEMVLRAQYKGYGAVIVMNKKGEDGLVPMGFDDFADEVLIPSVFVGWTSGSNIRTTYCYNCSTPPGEYTLMLDVEYTPYKPYILWPFAAVVGVCFLVMLSFLVFKWCHDLSKKRKSRLSTKVLKKIPTKKYKKGDMYDVCAICLEDYEEGDKLRVLPCQHVYHCPCIDPWLTKKKKTCPVCKRKVIPGRNPDSESDSDSDVQSSTERTPLLRNNNQPTSARTSTFDQSGLPEAVRNVQQHQTSQPSYDSSSDSDSSSQASVSPLTAQQTQMVVNRVVVNGGFVSSSSSEDEDDTVQGAGASKGKKSPGENSALSSHVETSSTSSRDSSSSSHSGRGRRNPEMQIVIVPNEDTRKSNQIV